jgi:hypothetical protein
VAKVELYGKLQPGVTGKDLIVTLCGYVPLLCCATFFHRTRVQYGGLNALSIQPSECPCFYQYDLYVRPPSASFIVNKHVLRSCSDSLALL